MFNSGNIFPTTVNLLFICSQGLGLICSSDFVLILLYLEDVWHFMAHFILLSTINNLNVKFGWSLVCSFKLHVPALTNSSPLAA